MRLHVHVEPRDTCEFSLWSHSLVKESKLKSHNWHTNNLTDVVGDASSFKDYCVNCFSRKDVLNTSDLTRKPPGIKKPLKMLFIS